MENNKHTFDKADAEKTIQSLKTQARGREEEVKKALFEYAKDGKLQAADLEDAIEACDVQLTKHSVVALKRKIGRENNGAIDVKEFLTSIGIEQTPTAN